jgi:hypothetical protein
LAPRRSSQVMLPVLPYMAAHISGVWPWESTALTAAPLAAITARAAMVDAAAQSEKAEAPSARACLASAPAAINLVTMPG